MEMRTEQTWTFCANDGGVVDAVARIASRSFRRARRQVESSTEVDGPAPTPVLFVELGPEGGFLVASDEGFVGREVIAASRSLTWWAQKVTYRFMTLSK